MGQQTNISFYIEGNIAPSSDIVLRTLKTLGVDESLAFLTKYKALVNAWEHRDEGSLPAWELNRERVSLTEAVQYVEQEKEVVISVVETERGLGKSLIVETWRAVPESLAQGCIIGNNDCTIGMHDIFGMASQVEEKEVYIGRASFSVNFWGYHCPKDIDQFREIVENLPIVSEVASALSQALNQPVKTAIYMNL